MRLINQRPGHGERIVLGAMLFMLLVAVYMIGSNIRLTANPDDKLLPSLAQMGAAIWQTAFVPEQRSGDYLLWSDTAASLARLLGGVTISALLAVVLGIPTGLIPRAQAALSPFVTAICLVPPITILPILFIVFGLGETSKVMLIVIGTAPYMVRTIAQAVADIPYEQMICS
jgi:NitT/TauT family transport system permease protein